MKVETFVVGLVGACSGDGPSEVPLASVPAGDDVDRLDPVAIVKAGKFTLVVEVIEDLVFFHDVRWQSTGGQLGVVSKEAFAIDQYPRHFLALGGDVAAGIHLYTG